MDEKALIEQLLCLASKRQALLENVQRELAAGNDKEALRKMREYLGVPPKGNKE